MFGRGLARCRNRREEWHGSTNRFRFKPLGIVTVLSYETLASCSEASTCCNLRRKA